MVGSPFKSYGADMHGFSQLIEPEALKSYEDARTASSYLTSQGKDVFLIERKDTRHVFVITREHDPKLFFDTPDFRLLSFTSARGVQLTDEYWHEMHRA